MDATRPAAPTRTRPSRSRARRVTAAALLVGFLAMTLSSCLKIDMDLKVNADDTVDGEIVFGLQKDVLEQFGMDPSDPEAMGGESEFDDVPFPADVATFDEDGYIGEKASFEGVPLEQFVTWLNENDEEDTTSDPPTTTDDLSSDMDMTDTSEDCETVQNEDGSLSMSCSFGSAEESSTTGEASNTAFVQTSDDSAQAAPAPAPGELEPGAFSLVHEGDQFIFKTRSDPETSGQEIPGFKPEGGLTIEFPGPVTESNGEIDGNKVTFTVEQMLNEDLTAVAMDSGGAGGLPIVPIVLGVLLLGVLGGAGFLFITARNTGEPLLAPIAPLQASVQELLANLKNRGGDTGPEPATAQQTPVRRTRPTSPELAHDPFSRPTPEPVQQPAPVAQPPAPVAPPVAPAAPAIPAGWYPTADGLVVRYHDGNDWTEHTAPNPALNPGAAQ